MLINDETSRPPLAREARLPDCMRHHMTELTLEGSALTRQTASTPVMLDFIMQPQQQNNWCWSAVAVSMGNYYKTGNWTQCGVASEQLDRECCKRPRPCDVPSTLDRALKITRTFSEMVLTRLQPDAVERQINMGRPVGLRCAWNGGGAHFMAIYGYDNSYIMVADSIYGYSLNFIYAFPVLYNGGGTWTHSYFTCNTLENA